ncbi:MAG: hypothetical protein NTV68_02420 [Methanomicrobiales archaeon]|nr:hypothetical protein [Methanomicrobiales archaeon]
MIQKPFNTGNRTIIPKNCGPDIAFENKPDTEELRETPMKLRPVITNICISLLVMAIFAVCFRL